MKITVLSDNRSNEKCLSEHGLSLFLENNDGSKILLDTGASDVFVKNAGVLGIDINDVDFVILSHGHWDHGNGLEYIKGKKLICHPSCFLKRYRKKDKSYIGLKLNKDDIERDFSLMTSKSPYSIADNVFFLGGIPRLNDFESKETSFCLEDGSDDFVPDDSALAIITNSGLVVISGCAHSGICNTVEYAKEITGIKKIYAVMGGFHLKKIDYITLQSCDYFIRNGIRYVYPCHCVEEEVVNFFAGKFDENDIIAGNSITM